jgi:hypothetical protein
MDFSLGIVFSTISRSSPCSDGARESSALISPEALAGFPTFDTKCIREIYEIGYNATLEKIGAIEKALVGRP